MQTLTTIELLDRLKAAKGLKSDYQLFKYLGWKQTTLSSYRIGRSRFGRAHAMRIADELALPREYVLACVELERETEPAARGAWQSIAQAFRGAATITLIACGALFAGTFSPANTGFAANVGPAGSTDRSIHYAKYRRGRDAAPPRCHPICLC